MSCRFESSGQCHLIAANRAHGSPEVSPARCAACPHYQGPSRGLGDTIAAVAKSVGVAPCGGCQKRREALNAAVPFRDA